MTSSEDQAKSGDAAVRKHPGKAPSAAMRAWLKENEKAITEYNTRIERTGLFNEGLRLF